MWGACCRFATVQPWPRPGITLDAVEGLHFLQGPGPCPNTARDPDQNTLRAGHGEVSLEQAANLVVLHISRSGGDERAVRSGVRVGPLGRRAAQLGIQRLVERDAGEIPIRR